MLSNKNTLRSSTSTLVTGSVTNPSIHFNQEDIKVIFVKSKKSNRKASTLNEKKETQEDGDTSNFKPILRSSRKYTTKSNISKENKFETKKVKFIDEDDNISEGSKKIKLAEIYIVPSYKNFYNNVIVDEENNKMEKIRCKCACIIF
jgi:hypothetical protein